MRAFNDYLMLRGAWQDTTAMLTAALTEARRLGETTAQGRLLYMQSPPLRYSGHADQEATGFLGDALGRLGRCDEARAAWRRAAGWLTGVDDARAAVTRGKAEAASCED